MLNEQRADYRAVHGVHQPAPQSPATRLEPGHMAFKSVFVGRMEKRLPIAVVVRLTRLQDQPADAEEMTHTDNISPHGARVVSSRPWQIGEEAQVPCLNEEIAICGKVVYCQKFPDDRHFIGLNFQGCRVTWSTYQTCSGS